MTNTEARFIITTIGIRSGREGQAIDVCVKALEKQIPKKTERPDSTTWAKCSSCGKFLHNSNNYCGMCGQKIDWSE